MSRLKVKESLRDVTARKRKEAGLTGLTLNRDKPLNKRGARSRRQHPQDRQVRESARQRDAYTCQRCGCPAKSVHHLFPVGSYPELAFETWNLLVLCGSCHLDAPDSAHADMTAFRGWAADRFERFAERYDRIGDCPLRPEFAEVSQ